MFRIMLFLVLSGFSTLASAACLGTDTLGNWKVFFSFASEWRACDIGVWFGGEISGGSCVHSNGTVVAVVGGRFSVDKSCDVTGRIITTEDKVTLQIGRMDLTKLNVEGVAQTDTGVNGTFSAVRK